MQYVCETTDAESVSIHLEIPLEDNEIVVKLGATVQQIKESGRKPRLALFETVASFLGVCMPWEALVEACRATCVLSLVDGAHGVGHIDLTHLDDVAPDFFAGNCYK